MGRTRRIEFALFEALHRIIALNQASSFLASSDARRHPSLVFLCQIKIISALPALPHPTPRSHHAALTARHIRRRRLTGRRCLCGICDNQWRVTRAGLDANCGTCFSPSYTSMCTACNAGYALLADNTCSNAATAAVYPLPSFLMDNPGTQRGSFTLRTRCIDDGYPIKSESVAPASNTLIPRRGPAQPAHHTAVRLHVLGLPAAVPGHVWLHVVGVRHPKYVSFHCDDVTHST